MKTETAENILAAVGDLVTALAPPSVAGPARAIRVLVEDALGVAHELTEDGVSVVPERETEAGRSISKASRLAGLREAIARLGNGADENGHFYQPPTIDAIMAEVARRMP